MVGQNPVVSNNFMTGVRSILVTMRREERPNTGGGGWRARFRMATPASTFGAPSPSLEYTMRTGAERVQDQLATSALALPYLKWGRASPPVPGAVAVSGRRGGGHVAIVSRVEGNQVYVWNPSPRAVAGRKSRIAIARSATGAGVINRRGLVVLAVFTIAFVGLAFS
jgi:hypothetical protein